MDQRSPRPVSEIGRSDRWLSTVWVTTTSRLKLQWKHTLWYWNRIGHPDRSLRSIDPTSFFVVCKVVGGGDQFFWRAGWQIIMMGRGGQFFKNFPGKRYFFTGGFAPIFAMGRPPIPPPSRTGGTAAPVLCWRGVPFRGVYRINYPATCNIYITRIIRVDYGGNFW